MIQESIMSNEEWFIWDEYQAEQYESEYGYLI